MIGIRENIVYKETCKYDYHSQNSWNFVDCYIKYSEEQIEFILNSATSKSIEK